MNISFFNKIFSNKPERETSVIEFLNSVKHGTYKHLIDPINNEPDKGKRKKLKENTLPYVTISGTFPEIRKKDGLVKHSGFLCLDIDDSDDILKDWENIINDKHTFGAFKSASGLGIAVIVKINPKKHLEAFLSIERYYLENFQIRLDKSCKDITRPRFVSNDPNAFINESADLFNDYLKKADIVQKVPNIIAGRNDIEYIIEQVQDRRVDITRSSYHIWLEVGFAIASEYGEGGRQYYHAISQFSNKYKNDVCDRQYSHCVKSGGSGVQLSTLFYYAKESNLDLVSPKTKHVVAVAKQGKRGARSSEDVIKMLEEIDGISKKDSSEIVEKVFNAKNDSKLVSELSILEQLEIFLRNNYNLKRNEITRYIENNGEEVDTVFINSAWLQAKRIVSDKTSFDVVDKLIGSDFTPNYNPLKEFLEANAHMKPTGLIDQLCDVIDTDTGLSDFNPSYKYVFIRKWFVGIIASIYGGHSPLLLVLLGGQRTGKTEFFRRLLPKEINNYYAESKLDAGKDDDILMCQKLLICDDEMGGKSKQEAKKIKEATSKDWFTLREPYGRKNVRLKRLAVLCGTSNDSAVLNDPTGNRRIIPVNVKSINHGKYNSIDKLQLLIEAFHLYNDGFDYNLTGEDVELLNRNTSEFETINQERELISCYLKTPEYMSTERGSTDKTEFMTATQIKTYIEEQDGAQKINQWKLSGELKSLGFQQSVKRIFGKTMRVYEVIKIDAVGFAGELYKKEQKKSSKNGNETDEKTFF